MNRILVVDDDKEIQTALHLVSRNEDFQLISAFSIEQARQLLNSTQFDLILLDIMLPDGNGFDLLQTIRDFKITTPVLCLSSKDDEAFKVAGLGIGADDYMTKPFSVSLLKSKIKALIRRSTVYAQPAAMLSCGDFIYDPQKMIIRQNDRELDLTSKELQVLRLFLEHPNQVFTKEQIYFQVWNNNVVDDNTITVYIKRLRNKIEKDPSSPQHLITVWGIGYKFKL
ncbi:response regulator transcription factor [Holdemania massiliensis]|uniref:response regulator transcription factor n=1 Tax=Holdemania massiliensis TaxID=1468449 RepID=UPI001F06EE1A|nr:response regulator transcription factor [Holdemania massiliensis]MCH1942217.1 response regulator transcription factor [Holdemania massiliensis]